MFSLLTVSMSVISRKGMEKARKAGSVSQSIIHAFIQSSLLATDRHVEEKRGRKGDYPSCLYVRVVAK